MENKGCWRLCAGTFFVLISATRNDLPAKSEMYNGKRSLWTEPGTLFALARIVTPDLREPTLSTEQKTLRDNTRDLKACINWGGSYFRLNDASSKKAFDDRIKDQYSFCLEQMTEFTNTYLELHKLSRKDEFLVKALLEVLAADTYIADDVEIYASEDGSTITKRELLSAPTVCFEALLLGIWHYVLLCGTPNTVGKETYTDWCPPKGGAERVYEAAIGENSARDVKITFHYPDNEEVSEEESEEAAERTDAGIVDSDDWETVEDDPRSSKSNPYGSTQNFYNNSNVFNINISGNNNNVIAHADTVYANKE